MAPWYSLRGLGFLSIHVHKRMPLMDPEYCNGTVDRKMRLCATANLYCVSALLFLAIHMGGP